MDRWYRQRQTASKEAIEMFPNNLIIPIDRKQGPKTLRQLLIRGDAVDDRTTRKYNSTEINQPTLPTA